MTDYLSGIAIQAGSFHNNMADKTVWQISEYSLYHERGLAAAGWVELKAYTPIYLSHV